MFFNFVFKKRVGILTWQENKVTEIIIDKEKKAEPVHSPNHFLYSITCHKFTGDLDINKLFIGCRNRDREERERGGLCETKTTGTVWATCRLVT